MAAALDLSEIKKLTPDERIKKLKSVQEKKKEEMDEVEKLIKESMNEARLQQDIKNIPLPEREEVNVRNLFAGEEESLEEKVESEKPKAASNDAQVHYRILTAEMANRPSEEMARRLESIYQEITERGYISAEQAREAYVAGVIARQREEDIRRGTYERIDESVTRQLGIAQSISHWIRDQYLR